MIEKNELVDMIINGSYTTASIRFGHTAMMIEYDTVSHSELDHLKDFIVLRSKNFRSTLKIDTTKVKSYRTITDNIMSIDAESFSIFLSK